jgi:hypothetical protein
MSLLNDASLVLIPSGYKEDKVYSIIPSDGSGDLDFVRGSEGTRINSLGQVENVCWNLYPYSEAIDNAAWGKFGTTVNANQTTAPNGTNTADKLNDTISATSSDYIINLQNPLSYIGGTPYTVSFYAKNIDRRYIYVSFVPNAFGVFKRAFFDLQDGVISSYDAGVSATITSVGNGWYRCSATCTATTTTTTIYGIYIGLSANGISHTYINPSVKSVYFWGIQLNTGALKPYFPTTDRLNVPRLTYENGCPSLLLEKQSTNLALYSEQFDNAIHWAKTRATVTANSIISPDGTQNADLLTDTTFTNNINYTEQAISVSGQTTTYSIFVKKGTSPYISFGFYDNAAHGYIVDTTTWSVTSTFGSPTSFTKQSIGNGWYRISMTKTASTNFIYVSYGVNPNSNGANYNGTSSLTAYFWGAQIEISAYPTSYIPTTSTSVTRLADSCYKTGISSLIGQTEGTIYADFYYDGVSVDFNLLNTYQNSTPTNRIQINIASNKYLTFYSHPDCFIASASAVTMGRHKVAVVYKNDDFALYLDGVLIGTDTSGAVVTTDSLILNDLAVLPNVYKQKVQFNTIALWKRRLTNTELAQLTTL